MQPTLKQIKEALDAHPEGVVVGLYHPIYENHYLLFTKCVNPEETNPYNYQFIVATPRPIRRRRATMSPLNSAIPMSTLAIGIPALLVC